MIQIGTRLNEKTALALRRTTNLEDRAEAGERTGVSEGLLRKIVFRQAPITQHGYSGLEALLTIACEKTKDKIEQANEDVALLHEIMREEFIEQ